jgi:hypothetical protein
MMAASNAPTSVMARGSSGMPTTWYVSLVIVVVTWDAVPATRASVVDGR